MGLIYAEIELINSWELETARKQMMDLDEVKRNFVTMLVDTGAVYLSINESIQERLQLPTVGSKNFELADGRVVKYKVVGPVEVRFGNRQTLCEALVLPGNSEPLLGAIPMEGMDVIIDAAGQELVTHPDHPAMAQLKLKYARLLD